MGFNLAEFLGGAQVGHDSRMEIEYIKFENIAGDDGNFYVLSGLEELAGNIETVGLQQPIVVRPAADPDKYIIVSGHRRRAAWEILWTADREKWAEIPCIVTANDELPELQQLRLIFANCNTRTLTSAELAQQAAEVERCLYALKESGMEFPGRMRDHVAEAVNASKSKLGRLKIIREGLIPEFQEQWEGQTLADQTALALAKMDRDMQFEILNLSRKTGGQTAYALDNYVQRRKKVPGFCVQLKSGCYHAPVIREKMWKAHDWEATCEGCCMNCKALETCRESCNWCKAVIDKKAAMKAETKARRNAEKQENADKAAPVVAYLGGVLGRIYDRMQKKHVTVDQLHNCGTCMNPYVSPEALPLLMGAKTVRDCDRIPIAWGYSYSDCQGLIDASRKLGCSIDWLLTGEEPQQEAKKEAADPLPGWQTGEPSTAGTYLAAYELLIGSKLFYGQLTWNGKRWQKNPQDPASAVDTRVVKFWIELPV